MRTFPRFPPRDDCYDFNPESPYPVWPQKGSRSPQPDSEILLPERALDAKPREVARGASVNHEPDPGSRGRRVAPHSIGCANQILNPN
jgi:hypothetical protein